MRCFLQNVRWWKCDELHLVLGACGEFGHQAFRRGREVARDGDTNALRLHRCRPHENSGEDREQLSSVGPSHARRLAGAAPGTATSQSLPSSRRFGAETEAAWRSPRLNRKS